MQQQYHVNSKEGNDEWPGTKEKPFKTIEKAFSTCKADHGYFFQLWHGHWYGHDNYIFFDVID